MTGAVDSLRRRLNLCLLCIATLGGCSDRDGDDRTRGARASSADAVGVARTRRVFRRALDDTAWLVVLGGDSGRASATSIAADGRQLYLVDGTSRRIAALDVATGVQRWATAIVGTAGDTIAPYAVEPSRRGGVLVTDGTAGQLWHVPPDAGRARRISLSTGETPTRVCELPDSTLLVTPEVRRRDFHLFDRRGVARATRSLPWPTLRTADDLQLQFVFAPSPDGCVVGLSLGVGFARLSADGFASPKPYIEPVAIPGVDSVITPTLAGRDVETELHSKEFAALDAVATATRIAFSFGGQTTERNHVIDVYDSAGVYRESFRTSHGIGGMAATDSALFILTRRYGLPVVVAFRWPR